MDNTTRTLWPPQSPDLTHEDLHLWCHLDGAVYFKTVDTRHQLWRLIKALATTIHMPGKFQFTKNSWHHMAQLCF